MKEYRYTLTCENDATSETLHFNPEGWDKKGLVWKENRDYHGILRSFTLDKLGFIADQKGNKGGKTFIESKYNTYGIEANISILIEQRNHSTMGWATYFEGKLTWTNSPEKDNDFIYFSFVDGAYEERFSENDEQEVSLTRTNDLKGNAVTLDTYNTITLKQQDLLRDALIVSQINDGTAVVPLPISEEFPVNVYSETYNQIGDDLEFTGAKLIYTNNTGDTVKLRMAFSDFNRTMSFNVSNTGAPSTSEHDIEYKLYVQTGVSTFAAVDQVIDTIVSFEPSEIVNYNSTSMNPESNPNITNDLLSEIVYYTINVANGDSVYLYAAVSVTAGNANASDTAVNVNLTFDFNFSEKLPEVADTTCKVFFPYEAFNNVLKLITGVSNDLYSPVLGRTNNGYASDGALSLIGLTNGYQIRNFDISKKPIFASFKDLFQSYYSIKPIYLSYDRTNERFVIDDISVRFDNTEILNIEDISDFKLTYDKDYYFNLIKAGQKEKVDYENINGIEEFNVPTEYNTQLDIKNIYDIQSVYGTDGIGIEILRREQYTTSANEDTKEDEKNYLIECVRDGVNYESRQLQSGETILNLLNATTHLNVNLSPKRCLLRHGAMINSIYFKNSSGVFQFLNSQITSDLSAQLTGESAEISEQGDVVSSSLDTPYFIPETIEFNHPVTAEIISIINSSQNGYVTVTNENGDTYKGFIIDVRTDSYDRTGNWKLLRKYE